MAKMSKKARLAKLSKGRKFWGALYSVIGVGAGTQQVLEKDLQFWVRTGDWGRWTGMQKVQASVSRLIDRFTGISIFPNVALPIQGPTINPWGIWNKWTGMGIAGIVYASISRFSPVKLPHAGKAKGVGAALLTGGIIGGLFDPPPNAGESARPNDPRLQVGPRQSAW